MVVARRLLLALAVLCLSGCATIQSVADWPAHQTPPVVVPGPVTPPVDPPPVTPPGPVAGEPYIVTAGQQLCRDLDVPAWVEFTATGKQPGTPAREEVSAWAFGPGDWGASNPKKGTFAATARDYSDQKAKLKVYGTDKFSGEPFLAMPWTPGEAFLERLAVDAGEASWTVKRASDGATATARQAAKTPGRVLICIGDPGSRKAAIGSTYRGIRWSDEP